jgi:hypothetical protein
VLLALGDITTDCDASDRNGGFQCRNIWNYFGGLSLVMVVGAIVGICMLLTVHLGFPGQVFDGSVIVLMTFDMVEG